MSDLKTVLHALADRVRHTDEQARADLHHMIDALADDVEKGADIIDPPTTSDQDQEQEQGTGPQTVPAP